MEKGFKNFFINRIFPNFIPRIVKSFGNAVFRLKKKERKETLDSFNKKILLIIDAMDVENEIILMKVQPLREWNSSILSPLVIYITVDRIFTGSKIFSPVFFVRGRGIENLLVWRVKGGPGESRAPRLGARFKNS